MQGRYVATSFSVLPSTSEAYVSPASALYLRYVSPVSPLTSFSVFPSTSDATAARSLRPYCSHPLTKLFRSFLVQLPKPCARSSSFSA